MTDELSELERARIDSNIDNTRVTPEQLLRLALDDLRKGHARADACLIITLIKPKDGMGGERNIYRANMGRMDEIAMLEYSKQRALDEWMRK